MTTTICPITPNFVAEVGDVDLGHLSVADLASVKAAFWKYSVLIFPDQHLTGNQHLDFARAFGPIETDRVLDAKLTPPRLDQGFADISNLTAEGRIWAGDSRQRMYKACSRSWSHTPRSVNSSIPTAGGRTISSCGTTAARCTAAPITTTCGGSATCAAPR